jgi:hypothetical protein
MYNQLTILNIFWINLFKVVKYNLGALRKSSGEPKLERWALRLNPK